MNKEILLLATSLSNEKGLSEDVVFSAIESALAAVAERKYEEEVLMRVSIDRKSGDYETFRCWLVVEEGEEDLEMPDQQMTVEQAAEFGDDIAVGSIIEEPIESFQFGRIEAQQAKQVLVQKVREAERDKTAAQYNERIGELIIGSVKRVTREFAILDMGSNAEAMLVRDEMMPRDMFRMNDSVKVYLFGIAEDRRGPQLLVSRTRPELLIELFKVEVPEIGEEVIEVMGAARDPGARSKIAVKTNDGRVDPVGACVGMRGARVQAISNELGGERVDIVLWDANPAQFVINAMAPADVQSIVVDEASHSIDVIVEEDQLAQAIGRGGQNIRMASELTGWHLNVMSPEQAEEKTELEANATKTLFVNELGVDDEIASALAIEGFMSLEEVAYVAAEELLDIDGFDEEIVKELQARASDILTVQQEENESLTGSDAIAKLSSVENISDVMIETLATHGIVTLDDLAEQSIDELIDIVDIDAEAAGKLIMKAREHWFDN